ncbi:MAG TPA: alpha/beta hydrolase fold domain-containing protein [Bryobacteraceae bacterium]|nr:alpha/beta hydrolase fold domain-containing protein [Bryobacteraceae bacterium]
MSFWWLALSLLASFSLAQESSAHQLARGAKKHKTQHQLDIMQLDAIHEARIEFMKKRLDLPELGVYQDFRAVLHVPGAIEETLKAAKDDDVQVVLEAGPADGAPAGLHDGVLFLPGFAPPGREPMLLAPAAQTPATEDPKETAYFRRAMEDEKQWKKLIARMKDYPDEVFAAAAGTVPQFLAQWDASLARRQKMPFDPYEVSFRHLSTHILARELTASSIRGSLAAGRTYMSHDWLCDPSGLTFVAVNNLGAYDIGDRVPLAGNTRLEVRLPVTAHLKVIHNGEIVFGATDLKLSYPITEEGTYRLSASLSVESQDRSWISTNPLYVFKPGPDMLRLPAARIAENVAIFRDIPYTKGKPEDANKHKLDLYVPKAKKNFPVLVFIHGGAWRSGDRALYTALGNRFAKAGIGVAIPSYRLAPANAPPAQIEDVAAAFAWVKAYIGSYGGDPERIYISGHSAGGHLAALLALDTKYLQQYGLSPANIKGVAALSGVYDVRNIGIFGPDELSKRDASPLFHVRASPSPVRSAAPPFLITYCQWDYPALPYQARQFYAALRKAFIAAQLVYIPGENHISEIVNVWKDNDPIANALIQMVH